MAPKLGGFYLRLGQQDQTEVARTDDPSKDVEAQLNRLKIGLMHGGQIDTLVALWHNLFKETKTPEHIIKHNWRPYHVFGTIYPSS